MPSFVPRDRNAARTLSAGAHGPGRTGAGRAVRGRQLCQLLADLHGRLFRHRRHRPPEDLLAHACPIWRGRNSTGPPARTTRPSRRATARCSRLRIDRRSTSGPGRTRCSSASVRGFLREGDTITVRFGDRARARPAFGCRPIARRVSSSRFLWTPSRPMISPNCRFAELRAGCRARRPLEGDLADAGGRRASLSASRSWPRIAGATRRSRPTRHCSLSTPRGARSPGCRRRRDAARRRPLVLEISRSRQPGDLSICSCAMRRAAWSRGNPLRVVAAAPLRQYWGDLHGQSEETIGTNSARELFRATPGTAPSSTSSAIKATIFRSRRVLGRAERPDARRSTSPAASSPSPATSGRATPACGGDRNVFFMREGQPIHRSSHALVDDAASSDAIATRAGELFAALEDEDAVVIAHVGGRYADIGVAHDGAAGARGGGAFDLGHVRVAAARRVRAWATASASSATATTTRGGPARRDPGASHLRRDRRAHLLSDAGADARGGVRGAAPPPSLWHDRHASFPRWSRPFRGTA